MHAGKESSMPTPHRTTQRVINGWLDTRGRTTALTRSQPDHRIVLPF